MNYNEFKNSVQQWPLILSQDLILLQTDKQNMRNQLKRWQNKKLLFKLKRGMYLLNPNDRKVNPSRAYIANQLYHPSYVSLEYALKFYDLIPEQVSDLTSITTRKTLRLKNEAGTFIYQHIKPRTFRGFKALKDEAGLIFFIAEPEKAAVDFFYLNLKKFKESDEKVFEESYRLQNVELLKTRKVMKFANLFGSGKLMRISQSFCKFIEKEGGK